VHLSVAQFKHVNGRVIRQRRDVGMRPVFFDQFPSPLLCPGREFHDLPNAVTAETELLRERDIARPALAQPNHRRVAFALRFGHRRTHYPGSSFR
jgi:hypothetical protein